MGGGCGDIMVTDGRLIQFNQLRIQIIPSKPNSKFHNIISSSFHGEHVKCKEMHRNSRIIILIIFEWNLKLSQ